MTARAYTVATLAEEWDCSESVIRKLVAGGELESFRLGISIRITVEAARRHECKNTPSSVSGEDGQPSISTPKPMGGFAVVEKGSMRPIGPERRPRLGNAGKRAIG